MNRPLLPASLAGYRIHLVGIKGTGMTALAEILATQGAILSGSDGPETFYTDQILKAMGIPYWEDFSPSHISPEIRLVIHSAAYSRESNPELMTAASSGIVIASYPEALGALSRRYDSSGIAGTHGKTTTAALSGTVLKHLKLPVVVLVASEVHNFGDRSSLLLGTKYLVAETCEYRRHFLNFKPRRMVITSIEAEHLDYYQDLEDVLQAFEQYAFSLPPGGTLIANQDDPGVNRLISRLKEQRQDLDLVPYGRSAAGRFRMHSIYAGRGIIRFKLGGFARTFNLKIPGLHSAYNAAAAVALSCRLLEQEKGRVAPGEMDTIGRALASFQGCKRRGEVLGEAGSVLFVDDYGHHPSEIRTALDGLKRFYPDRRLVVDFMPHTYSRTAALLAQFGTCFQPADEVILHGIYATVRERNGGGVTGRDLAREVRRYHPAVRYFDEPRQALPYLKQSLKPGDLLVTMGAGDNWKLGKRLLAEFEQHK